MQAMRAASTGLGLRVGGPSGWRGCLEGLSSMDALALVQAVYTKRMVPLGIAPGPICWQCAARRGAG